MNGGPVSRSVTRWLPWVGLAAAGIVLVLLQTRFGPGASGDSAYYLMGARNLAAGDGYSRFSGGYELRPITGFPPFYSMVLSAFALVRIDLVQGARWLNAILFGVNALLLGWIIRRYAGSIWPGLLGGGLFALSSTQLGLHSWVMSEPLYTFLTLATLIALSLHLDRPRTTLLLLAGALAGLASLTRYLGPSLAAAGVLGLLVLGKEPLRKRLMEVVAFGALSALPLAAWLARNASVAGTLTNREWIYHPMRPELLKVYLAEASSWFAPPSLGIPTAIRAGIAVLLALGIPAAFVLSHLRSARSAGLGSWALPRDRALALTPWLLLSYLAAYLAVLFVNSTFLDAGTTLGAPPRYLAPFYAAAVIMLVVMLSDLIAQTRIRAGLSMAAAAYGLALLGLHAQGTIQLLRDPIASIGYMGYRYMWTDVVAELRALRPDQPIVSNNPELVYILIGRPAYTRPIRFDAYQLQYRDDFEQQLAFTGEKLKAGGVMVVFGQPEQVDLDIVERLDADLLRRTPQALFYGYEQLSLRSDKEAGVASTGGSMGGPRVSVHG